MTQQKIDITPSVTVDALLKASTELEEVLIGIGQDVKFREYQCALCSSTNHFLFMY